jgi:hypothetical protein
MTAEWRYETLPRKKKSAEEAQVIDEAATNVSILEAARELGLLTEAEYNERVSGAAEGEDVAYVTTPDGPARLDELVERFTNSDDEQNPETLTWAQIRPDYQFSVRQEEAEQIEEWVRQRLNALVVVDSEAGEQLSVHYQLSSQALMTWNRGRMPYKRGYSDNELVAAKYRTVVEREDGDLELGIENVVMLVLDTGELYQL